MKTLKHLFTALLLMVAIVAKAHDFEVDGICYNILSEEKKTVEVTYRGDYYYSYSNEYIGSVDIPSSVISNGITYAVTSIGDNAFKRCTGLTSITIPNSVTSIGESAFEDCTGLTSITIPNSVTSIGDHAFYKCTGLKEVHISDLAAWCGIDFENDYSNPLYYAHNLYLNGELVTELVIPDGVNEIKQCAFSYCTGLTRVDIVDGVKSIGSWAFEGCSNLEELYISNTIESIAYYAFEDCTNILEIKVGSKKAITCNEYIFSEDVYNNALLYIPEGRKFAYEKTVPWNRFYIVETDFTDISGVKEQIAESKTVYDLQGRKVDNPTNGIYIVNGKKAFLK